MMNKMIKASTVVKVIITLVMLVLGIVIIVAPNTAMQMITLIGGIALIGYGILKTIFVIARKTGEGLALPFVCIALGILLIVFDNFVANRALPFVVAAWLIVMGYFSLKFGLNDKQNAAWRIAIIVALASLILGIITMVSVFTSTNFMGQMIGVYILIDSSLSLVNIIVLKE